MLRRGERCNHSAERPAMYRPAPSATSTSASATSAPLGNFGVHPISSCVGLEYARTNAASALSSSPGWQSKNAPAPPVPAVLAHAEANGTFRDAEVGELPPRDEHVLPLRHRRNDFPYVHAGTVLHQG